MGVIADVISAELASNAATVTAGVGGGGLIPVGCPLVTVSSDDANKQISLPVARVGDVIRIQVGSTGCELVASVATHKANNVLIGATNELALAANGYYVCEFFSADNWCVTGRNLDGGPMGKTVAALTTISITDAAGTPDYALSGLTVTAPYGLATLAEMVSLLYVVKNLQERVLQIETNASLTPDAL